MTAKKRTVILRKVIHLCNRPRMGVEQKNARRARSSATSMAAIACWLCSLARGDDIERAARRPDISRAAFAALREIAPELVREVKDTELRERLLGNLQRI